MTQTEIQDHEAERALLAWILTYHAEHPSVLSATQTDWMTHTDHIHVLDALRTIADSGATPDVVLLAAYLRKKMDHVAAARLAAGLATVEILPENGQSYVVAVREAHAYRRLQRAGKDLEQAVAQRSEEAIGRALYQAEQIRQSTQQRKTTWTMMEACGESLRTMEERMAGRHGVPWALATQNDLLGPMLPGELYVVCGRPGMGKSAFAMQQALHTAQAGQGVALFSLEMSADVLVQRFIASRSGVQQRCIRNPRLMSDTDWPRYHRAMSELSELPIRICDQGMITPREIRARVADFRREIDVKLFVIDYVQYINGDEPEPSREIEVARACRAIRDAARKYDVPCIMVAQLNRQVESRKDKRPMLSDLRESGAIEQDADIVIGCYRDAYYNDEADPGEAELLTLKNRHGPSQTLVVRWSGQRTIFWEDIASGHGTDNVPSNHDGYVSTSGREWQDLPF